MENSRLFAPVAEYGAAGDFYTLVSGERADQQGAPARTAWQLERLAAMRGWPVGTSLGAEAALREKLQVSRETLREAIRIVEGRGAMQMRRGRSGGLMLLKPPIERLAASLAAYLRATAITEDQLAQSIRALDQLLAWEVSRRASVPPRQPREPLRDWLARASGRQTYLIYVAALHRLVPSSPAAQPTPADLANAVADRNPVAMFRSLSELPFIPPPAPPEISEPGSHARAGTIAVRMIEQAATRGHSDLGSEARLCEDFDTSRSLIRQALRILQDLDVLDVRRGRGGGYRLRQPSPIGIIRQMFSWLAARNCDPFILHALIWDLNAANVRLAGERLAEMAPAERHAHCERIDRMLIASPGAARFIHLQQALAGIAACPIVDTIARCYVSYQARSYGDFAEDIRCPEMAVMEADIVAALRRCDPDEAERILRRLQDKAEQRAIANLAVLRNAVA